MRHTGNRIGGSNPSLSATARPINIRRDFVRRAMVLNQWQHNFLRRLVELGGSITVPDGVVNQDLIDLIEGDYVSEGDSGGGRTCYEITEAGRAAAKAALGE